MVVFTSVFIEFRFMSCQSNINTSVFREDFACQETELRSCLLPDKTPVRNAPRLSGELVSCVCSPSRKTGRQLVNVYCNIEKH